jgi:exopolysaccharide biosynthesis polyprenyl glycosylphosphotransferase
MTRRHGQLPLAILLAADTAAAALAYAAAYALRFHVEPFPVAGRRDELPARYLEALPAAALALVGAVALLGLYRRERLGTRATAGDALRAGGLGFFVLSALALLYWKEFQYSRLGLALAAVLFVPAFLVGRTAARALLLRLRARLRTPVAVVGGDAPARALADALGRNAWAGLHVAQVLAVGEVPAAWAHAERAEDLDALCDAVGRGRVREVFVALPAHETGRLPAVLRALDQVTADVRVVPDLSGALLLHPGAWLLSGLPVVSVRERPLYGLRAAGKRALDLALSAFLLVVLAPVLAVLWLLVRWTSPGPALYRQERMGLDGNSFAILKFRTMRSDAEELSGPVFARRGDPRTTPLGRVLRRLSLDELPQLWNVLRGEMSLVGPRPERAPFIEEFRRRIPGYMLRHSVKAGMTGWAQIHGLRGDSCLEQRLRYDLEYIDRWSLSLDLEILGRTAVQVIVGRNAY